MSSTKSVDRDNTGYNVQTSTVLTLPDQVLYPVSPLEFQVLCDGELSRVKANRDFFGGLFVSAFIGLIGLVATVDWSFSLQQMHLITLISILLLFSISAASGCGVTIQQLRYKKTLNTSAYSKLMERLADHFAKAEKSRVVTSSVNHDHARPASLPGATR